MSRTMFWHKALLGMLSVDVFEVFFNNHTLVSLSLQFIFVPLLPIEF